MSKIKTKNKSKPYCETKKVGGWNEMTFDRVLTHKGITWYRVKDGTDGGGHREYWIADIDQLAISVRDYEFKDPRWGALSYPNFHAALEGKLIAGLQSAKHRLAKLRTEADNLAVAIIKLEDTIKNAKAT